MARIIGLTGGIASGKSTVSAYLRKKGLPVVDADALVHSLQEPGGKLYQALIGHFGTAILLADGRLNRPKLSQLVFSTPEQMEASSILQDGIIREALAESRDRLSLEHEIVILDIPLLFEKGYDSWCDEIWLVMVDELTQLERLMKRNQLTTDQAQKRIVSQMSLTEKLQRSDRIIDNNGLLGDTYKQIDNLLEDLIKLSD